MTSPPVPAPGAGQRRRFLGVPAPEAGLAFLGGVCAYILGTLVFKNLTAPLWGEFNLRDLLTLVSIAVVWVCLAARHRARPTPPGVECG